VYLNNGIYNAEKARTVCMALPVVSKKISTNASSVVLNAALHYGVRQIQMKRKGLLALGVDPKTLTVEKLLEGPYQSALLSYAASSEDIRKAFVKARDSEI